LITLYPKNPPRFPQLHPRRFLATTTSVRDCLVNTVLLIIGSGFDSDTLEDCNCFDTCMGIDLTICTGFDAVIGIDTGTDFDTLLDTGTDFDTVTGISLDACIVLSGSGFDIRFVGIGWADLLSKTLPFSICRGLVCRRIAKACPVTNSLCPVFIGIYNHIIVFLLKLTNKKQFTVIQTYSSA